MIRECNFEDISDGRRYSKNDMVKLDTCDCAGCYKCCTNVGNTIVLDSFDMFLLEKATNKDFKSLLETGYIELNMIDGLILPNIKMNSNNQCSFLDDNGRCTVHSNRPGICRLFPLGRIYNEQGFDYFLQKDECIKELRAKIKIKKWLGINNLDEYEQYVLRWHNFIKWVGNIMIKLRDSNQGDEINNLAMLVLNTFFVEKISGDEKGFYAEINNKITQIEEIISKWEVAKC